MFDGLPVKAADAAARTPSALVRARVAWSLGRRFDPADQPALVALAGDREPCVRLHALEALTDHRAELKSGLIGALTVNMIFPDKRVRQAAARLAASLPEEDWERDVAGRRIGLLEFEITKALAAHWRRPADTASDEEVRSVAALVVSCEFTKSPAVRLDALRLLMLALGDYRLNDPPAEVFTGYSLQGPIEKYANDLKEARRVVRSWFGSGDDRLDDEAARFLAMMEDDDDALPAKVASMWTPTSSATRDMHYLIVYSRLRGMRGATTAGRRSPTPYSASTASSKGRPSAISRTGTPASSRSWPNLSGRTRE